MFTQRKNILKLAVLGLQSSVMALSFGCIKKRPDKFADNSGLERGVIVEKSILLGRSFTLTAGEETGEQNLSYKLTVEESLADEFNDLQTVDFETNTPLIPKTARIKGLTGYTYDVKYELSGDKLYVYKIGSLKSIPYFEKASLLKKSYGEKIGVPVSECKVSYYKALKRKDADGRETNITSEVPVELADDFKVATHVRVLESSCKEIDHAKERAALLPMSFLKNKIWQLSVFKTNASDYERGGNAFLMINNQHLGGWGVLRRVEVRPTDEKTMSAISVAIPEKVRGKDLNRLTMSLFDVEWKTFKLDKTASGAEEEVLNKEIPFDQAEYVKVDFLKSFNRTLPSLRSMFNDMTKVKGNKIKEVVLAEDLISYIVEANDSTVEYRVNFWKFDPNNGYVATSAVEKDGERYGTFNIVTPVKDDVDHINTIEDQQRVIRKMRFNPAKKEIVYHISEESPKNTVIDEVARLSVERLNKSFQNAVFKDDPANAIKVTLSDKRVRRGDPRYNILDFNSEDNTQTILGLGLPNFDEVTGEVLSAITYTYYGAYEKIVKKELLDYLDVESGLKGESFQINESVYGRGEFSLGGKGKEIVFPYYMSSGVLDVLQKNIPYAQSFRKLEEHANFVCFSEDCESLDVNVLLDTDKIEELKSKSFVINRSEGLESGLCARSTQPHKDFKFHNLQRHCGKRQLETLILKYKNLNGSAEILQDPTAKDCIDKFLISNLTETTIHEMLHNFGVAHNFRASADEDNHMTKELVKEVYGEDIDYEFSPLKNSSSIMDYSDGMAYPSQYDWAVLRYIYRDKVEGANGASESISVIESVEEDEFGVKYNKLKPIAQAEIDTGKASKYYEYCSDFEATYRFKPLCARWDRGTTPIEAVQSYIDEYNYLTKLYSNRGISARNPYLEGRQAWISRRIADYYSQWRIYLANFLGDDKKYLEGYRKASDFYKDFSAAISDLDDASSKKLFEYYGVRNLIFDFYRDIVFEAPLSCNFTKGSSVYGVDYDRIYTRIAARVALMNRQTIVGGCDSELVQDHAKEILLERLSSVGQSVSKADFEYHGSTGTAYNSYSYDVNANTGVRRDDVTGLMSAKYASAFALTSRRFAWVLNRPELFFPSILDEPEFRENFEYFLKNRITEGNWVNPETGDSSLSSVRLSKPLMEVYQQNQENIPYFTFINNAALAIGQSPLNVGMTSSYALNNYVEVIEQQDISSPALMKGLLGQSVQPSYITEAEFLKALFALFRASLEVPGSPTESAKRAEPFKVGVIRAEAVDINEVREKFGHATEVEIPGFLGSLILYPKNEEASFAKDLIVQADELNTMSDHKVEVIDEDLISELKVELDSAMNAFLEKTPEADRYSLVFYQNLSNEAMNGAIVKFESRLDAANMRTLEVAAALIRKTAEWMILETETNLVPGYKFTYEGEEIDTGGLGEFFREKVQSFSSQQDFLNFVSAVMTALVESGYRHIDASGEPALSIQDILDQRDVLEKEIRDEYEARDGKSFKYIYFKDEYAEKEIIVDFLLKILAWF